MSRRFQFSLEKLFLLTAWFAIACVVVPPVMRWEGIPGKYRPIIGIAAWLAAAKIVPGIFWTIRAYQRFRDSEL